MSRRDGPATLQASIVVPDNIEAGIADLGTSSALQFGISVHGTLTGSSFPKWESNTFAGMHRLRIGLKPHGHSGTMPTVASNGFSVTVVD